MEEKKDPEIETLAGPVYIVRHGDFPRRIAEVFTGDARRWTELVTANPQKPTIKWSGFVTFASLDPGEALQLPDGWRELYLQRVATWPKMQT